LPEIHNPNLQAQSPGSGSSGNSELLALLAFTLLALPVILGFDHFKASPVTQMQTQPHAVDAVQHDLTGQKSPKVTAVQSTTTAATAVAAETRVEANGSKPEALAEHTWISVVAKPLYRLLRDVHEHLGSSEYNWGWAIIIVTFLINLVILPARLAMVKSSLKMMQIQPKIETIKKRYAHLKMNDLKRTEMQAETMALYKSEGVNMYGSCLPMLIQMPILYAIYRVLAHADELRLAHWFWIPDLASPDPLHILPVFIIGSMFITQLITAQPGMDAAQRRIMAFLLPITMGFMMWRLSAGLSLYWGTGNVISLGIQLFINQSKAGKEMRAIAANRALGASAT
jgi:YidC/Oxa1 family membrane protein insertase